MRISSLAKSLLSCLALALLTASIQPAQPPPPWSPTKRDEISILSTSRALTAFRALCVDTFPDAAAFDRAAAASELRFTRETGMPRGRHTWTSRYGDLNFVEQNYWPGLPALPQCTFDLAISAQQSGEAFVRAIEAEFTAGAKRHDLPAAASWRLGRMNTGYWRDLKYATPFEDSRLVSLQIARVPEDWPF